MIAAASASDAVIVSVVEAAMWAAERSVSISANRVPMSCVRSSDVVIWSDTWRRTRYRPIAFFSSSKSARVISSFFVGSAMRVSSRLNASTIWRELVEMR